MWLYTLLSLVPLTILGDLSQACIIIKLAGTGEYRATSHRPPREGRSVGPKPGIMMARESGDGENAVIIKSRVG